MAEWKKIIVSGSDISQLNNDAGYLTSVTAQSAFVTASFNGTHLIADDSQGQLNFTSGSGGNAGILITANAGTDTLDISLGAGAVPNTALTNDSITVGSTEIDLGASSTTLAGLTSVTSTGFTGSLSSTSTLADGVTATTQTTGDNSTKVATTAFVAAAVTAEDLDIAGDGSTIGAVDLDSQSLTFTGQDGLQLSASAQTITATIADDSITNAKLDNNSITIGDTSVALGGSITAFSGSFQGDGSGLTGTGGASIIAGDAADNQVAVFNSTNTIDGYSTFTFNDSTNVLTVNGSGSFTGDLSVGNNLTVTGDLTVQGTTTTLNTANLLVEDRFALFNSGSATGDGGIVIQTETDGSGTALGWDDDAGRFGLQIGTKLAHNASSITPDSYLASVVTSDVAAYQKNGNIRVEGGDIFIYVE